MRFKNKVVLITGAAQGIGKATALAFAKEGANLALVDVRELSDVKQTVEREKRKVLALQVDVSSSGMVEKMVKATVDKFGRLDILVNNAGVISRGIIEKITDEELDLSLIHI